MVGSTQNRTGASTPEVPDAIRAAILNRDSGAGGGGGNKGGGCRLFAVWAVVALGLSGFGVWSLIDVWM